MYIVKFLEELNKINIKKFDFILKNQIHYYIDLSGKGFWINEYDLNKEEIEKLKSNLFNFEEIDYLKFLIKKIWKIYGINIKTIASVLDIFFLYRIQWKIFDINKYHKIINNLLIKIIELPYSNKSINKFLWTCYLADLLNRKIDDVVWNIELFLKITIDLYKSWVRKFKHIDKIKWLYDFILSPKYCKHIELIKKIQENFSIRLKLWYSECFNWFFLQLCYFPFKNYKYQKYHNYLRKEEKDIFYKIWFYLSKDTLFITNLQWWLQFNSYEELDLEKKNDYIISKEYISLKDKLKQNFDKSKIVFNKKVNLEKNKIWVNDFNLLCVDNSILETFEDYIKKLNIPIINEKRIISLNPSYNINNSSYLSWFRLYWRKVYKTFKKQFKWEDPQNFLFNYLINLTIYLKNNKYEWFKEIKNIAIYWSKSNNWLYHSKNNIERYYNLYDKFALEKNFIKKWNYYINKLENIKYFQNKVDFKNFNIYFNSNKM